MNSPDASESIVIIGAGMAGLFAALLVKQRRPAAEIVVVEGSGEGGGCFRGVELPGFGYCDRAMRLLYETGIPEFDALLHGLLPQSEWHVLPDNVKDVVGVYWRGALQTHTPYLDLRRLPASDRETCEREILDRIQAQRANGNGHPNGNGNNNANGNGNGNGLNGTHSASDYLRRRFGPSAAAHLERALAKFHGAPAGELDVTATHQPTMDRVVLYDEDRMARFMGNERLRSVLAWPDQLTLPVKRHPAQSGLYPRRFGINRVIDAAVARAREQGVQFLFNRRVSALGTEGGRIIAVELDDGRVIDRPDLVISANGPVASLALLKDRGEPRPNLRPPPRSWLVFLRVAERPEMGGLYHCWCFDESCRAFRVTNYAAYCPDARNADGFPICVEVWSDDETAEGSIGRALREVRAMGILAKDNRVVARAAVASPNLHALCTVETARVLRTVRTELGERSPENLITVGPHTEEGVLLLYEVCRSMHAAIGSRLA